ncbi:MAG: cyclic nucleotide-binding domain-containing protein, partial [Caldilineaceae bacterium]
MADPFIVSQLQRQSLFANLSDDQLQRVAEVSQVIQVQPGQYLFAQGQPVQAAQIFVSGRGALLAATAQGPSSQMGTVEAGQLINENAFFSDGVETASLRLIEPSVVIIIPREPVRQLMARDPALQANLRVLDASGGRDAQKVLFRGQRANETVYRLYHRHWWGFVRHAWIPFLLAGLFLVISVVIDTRFPGIGLVFGCLTVTVPLFSVGFLLWEWRNDQLIITDQRLVLIHMQAWRLTRSVSGIPLDRIGEVQVNIPGGDIFANLFGYGTLVVKTTADRSGLTIRFMPDPSSVQKTVFEQRDLYQQRSRQMDDDESQVRAQVAQALGMAVPGGAQTGGSDAINEAEEVHFTAGKAG